MYLAKVYIQLRPTVSDPQGQTIRGGLLQLGFDSVTSVRAGKYMEITLDADTRICTPPTRSARCATNS